MAREFKFITYDPQYKTAYRDLNARWIEKYFVIEPKDVEQLENPEECLADGGQVFFITHDGKAVGTCAMYKMDDGRYELAKMAVDPAFQGRGLSNTLMSESEAWVKAQGGTEVYIRSNTVLTPAITLYRKHGYVEVPREGVDPEYARCNIDMIKKI
jgi:GNAT superfamily N-acetyltransferase